MPSGENWQNDVLRDLRGGAAPQQPAAPQSAPAQRQPQQQPQHQPQGQDPQAQQPAPQQQPDQQQRDQQQPSQPGVPAQGAPAPQGTPGYGHPQQQAGYAYPPPPPPQQQQPGPGRQPQQQAAPYPQQQPYAAQAPHPAPSAHPAQPTHPAPQAAPQSTAASRTASATPRTASPDTRPVLDKRLAAAGLKPRRGEPFTARALRAVRRVVSSAAREVAETTATAEVLQRPVTTGRQIAVTSIRGGSGKTTVAALLGATYAHYRQDPVLVVEADPALGSLPVRLGAESLRWTTGDLAALVEPQMSLLDVTGYLVQLPDNAWLLPGSQGQVGAMLDTRAYERVMVSLRRYFGVTVVDCETLPAEVARTALSAAQARVLTVPATLEGIASTRSVLEWMRGLPRSITTSTVVVLTQTSPHPGLDLDRAAEQLKATGASVRVLPYDRHLAAGGAIRTDLLAQATRQAVTRLAAEAFELSQKRR
ncbi:CpaE family protein [Streptomyces sp. NPDC003247]|uniref:AAA family ATPase n=1 Tax=Streptomyces sp. NPDC003247 TaxID=3364677 RepID=UPI0036A91737